MKQAGITVFPVNMIDNLGMEKVIRQAIEIAGKNTAGIHFSFTGILSAELIQSALGKV